MSENDVIQASEIAEYVFCNRAWWMSKVYGRKSGNAQQLQEGSTFHEAHGALVRRAQLSRAIAYFLLAASVGVIIFSLFQLI